MNVIFYLFVFYLGCFFDDCHHLDQRTILAMLDDILQKIKFEK
jgi:hypothetical protein